MFDGIQQSVDDQVAIAGEKLKHSAPPVQYVMPGGSSVVVVLTAQTRDPEFNPRVFSLLLFISCMLVSIEHKYSSQIGYMVECILYSVNVFNRSDLHEVYEIMQSWLLTRMYGSQ